MTAVAPDPRAGAVSRLVRSLRGHGVGRVDLALVLGSGLGPFADRLGDARAIPCGELDGMPCSRVPGHAGRLVVGTLGGRRVLAQQGRVHLYEGWSAHEVTRAVRAFAALGAETLVLTNAAGCARPDWEPGTLMAIADHVDLQRRSPLLAGEAAALRRAGELYDPGHLLALERAAEVLGEPLRRGVYAGLLGPAYETPAEIRMLRWMGADAVGMSTVTEAVAARAAGMRVAAVSGLTNHAAGIGDEPLAHEDVVEAGRLLAERLWRLLEAWLVDSYA